jgi:hypothetical protein
MPESATMFGPTRRAAMTGQIPSLIRQQKGTASLAAPRFDV